MPILYACSPSVRGGDYAMWCVPFASLKHANANLNLLQRLKTDLRGVAGFPGIGHTFVSTPVVMVAFAQKESLKGIDND